MIRAAAHHLELALAAASRSPFIKPLGPAANGVEFHGFTTAVGVLVRGFCAAPASVHSAHAGLKFT